LQTPHFLQNALATPLNADRRHRSGEDDTVPGSARLDLGGDDELLLEASEGLSVVTNGSQMDFQGKNSQALVLSWWSAMSGPGEAVNIVTVLEVLVASQAVAPYWNWSDKLDLTRLTRPLG
jgi:hypothetical protein